MGVWPRPLLFTVALVVSLYIYGKRRHHKRSGGLPYPPGPKPAFLIGNLLQIPRSKQWITYWHWRGTYGDVVGFEAGGTRVLILNSARATVDLMEKRGAIYSDRNQTVMQQEVFGAKIELFAQMNNTPEFSLHRKVVNLGFSIAASRSYQPYQEKEAHSLLGCLLDSPGRYSNHLRRTTGAIILRVTYGHEVVTDDDDLVKLNEEALAHNLPIIDPTNFIVNFIPILRFLPSWAPGSGFKEYARIARDYLKRTADLPFKEIKDKVTAGSPPACYVSRLLEENGTITRQVDEEKIIKLTASLMYGAGSDTTLVAIKTFLVAMLLYPDVQKQIHKEIDAVIGPDRAPTFADVESLPYLHSCILESLRWKPGAPVGVPHSLAKDDVYEGMFIPKDTVVMANVWGILHDEKMYPDPDRFWPERWDGRFPDARDPRTYAFGFNRRICPGRHLAFNSLWIVVASIMAVFDVKNVKDAEGREVELDYDYEQAEFFLPWIECDITPRSPAAVALIKSLVSSVGPA
ncbi:hypothetical protein JAAARDRAFT_73848 [Jaapia argillacea MUCL 33604]|uniref:Cytochrome P450 n=1 Tax=Jaapia argillacea MUCL 33604 TaxID=933084 RepID=A0A067P8F0_9AGAM|nr:hypothetical protein JAAARDRAFT_73848 [Jaapia argillacea MUCL 33604]